MHADFWHQKWKDNEIGFHMDQPHPMLVQYVERLAPAPAARIFLPLCGKTLDIGWLLSRGYRVAGAELSETAVRQLFGQLGLEPQVEQVGSLSRFSGPDIDIFVGDIFALSAPQLGAVDAVYDRAALVALPESTRAEYTAHLRGISRHAPQLLITFEYDQGQMSGPPFAVSGHEVGEHYGAHFAIELLESVNVPGGLKGHCEASEVLWLLREE